MYELPSCDGVEEVVINERGRRRPAPSRCMIYAERRAGMGSAPSRRAVRALQTPACGTRMAVPGQRGRTLNPWASLSHVLSKR